MRGGPAALKAETARCSSAVLAQVKRGRRLVSRHGSHLAVGVGSVRGEVLVGDLRDQLPVRVAGLSRSAFFVVAFEESDHYVEAAVVTVVAVLVLVYVVVLPGLGRGPPHGAVGGRS